MMSHFGNILRLTGTYFNCIMFMVAGSCIASVCVLNFHHRLPETHDMPDWVSGRTDLHNTLENSVKADIICATSTSEL